MPKEDWENNPVHEILRRVGLWPFGEGEIKTVLDVACGLSLKSKFLKDVTILGVDIYEPYLRAIESDIPYALIKYDVRRISEVCLDNSFDLVYALDIIEHLHKEESLSLIDQCKRIAKKAVVVETPHGYVPQNMDIQGFGADTYQTHRSEWNKEELEGLGFQCVVRDYVMQDVKRHTDFDVDPNIKLIDGIFLI